MNHFIVSIKAFLGLSKSILEEESSKQVDSKGNTRWYKNGVLHRDNDLPAVIYKIKIREWWKNGQLHRDKKPACIAFGLKVWAQNGVFHRLDGPAVEAYGGRKKWYIHGIEYTKDEFEACLKKLALEQSLERTLVEKNIHMNRKSKLGKL